MPITNIQEVLDRLDEIVLEAETNGSRQGYFAVLYRSMTNAVLQGSANSGFADADRMAKLDTCFAIRYLDAYDAYRKNLPVTNAWRHAFDACKRNDITVFQHLLLGINTHINLDLAIAAAQTCPGTSIFDLQADYDHINNIIASLIDDTQDRLTRAWWPLRLLRRVMNRRQDAVVNFSITAARKAAWANAVSLANMNGTARDNYINGIDNMVIELANKIIKPGIIAGFILRLVRMTEYNDVKRTIQLIK